MNSSHGFTNLEIRVYDFLLENICYDFFSWQTENAWKTSLKTKKVFKNGVKNKVVPEGWAVIVSRLTLLLWPFWYQSCNTLLV